MIRTIKAASLLTATLTLTACASVETHTHDMTMTMAADPERGVVPITKESPLVAIINPVGNSNVEGTFHFYPVHNGLRVVASVTGLKPNSRHGCHIHAYGDASDRQSGSSAGVHFNPFNHDHALPPAEHRHAGAFPNLEADAQGNAMLDFTDETISVANDVTAILGRSVIIHEDEDVGAQPWGGAGGRIGLGVIGLAHPDHTPSAPSR